MAEVKQLNESDFDAAVGSGITLVDFWAPWCAPCRAMGPVLGELADSLNGQATIAKVNVEENPQLAAKFRVQSIPLLVLLKDGQEITRAVGVHPAGDLHEMIRGAAWSAQAEVNH
jgi:thioredoxin 1